MLSSLTANWFNINHLSLQIANYSHRENHNVNNVTIFVFLHAFKFCIWRIIHPLKCEYLSCTQPAEIDNLYYVWYLMRIVRHKSIQHYFLLSAGSAHCFLVCVSHSGRGCPSQPRESSCLLRENSTATLNGRFMSKGKGINHMPTFMTANHQPYF